MPAGCSGDFGAKILFIEKQARVTYIGRQIAKRTNDVTKFPTPVVSQTNTCQFCNGCKGNVSMASGSLPCFTVLTDEDDVPGSKFEREPEEYTVGQLKGWLKCRELKLSGKRDELLKCVSDCIKSGNHQTLDSSIDDDKWFSAKVLRGNAKLQANCSLSSLPFVPSTGWRAFPSYRIKKR